LTLVSGLLVLIAGTALGSSIANSGYDDQQNRAPVLRIALAAAAFLVALAALRVAVKRLCGGQPSNIAAALLVVLTLALIFLYTIVAIASGPL